MICSICNEEFDSVRSLHCHLKKHKTTPKEYWETYFPRYSRYLVKKINYRDYKSYQNAEFYDQNEMCEWLAEGKERTSGEKKEFLISKLKERIKEKDIKVFPQSSYFKLSKLPPLDFYKKEFGSIKKLSDSLNLDCHFTKGLPEDFWTIKNFKDMEIFIDSREQLPIELEKSIKMKLDFGDYTSAQEFHKKVFIERKSESDFKGTFGGGYARFDREMQRCVDYNSYMYVLVESTIDDVKKNNVGAGKCNLSYVWKNVKDLMVKYPNNLQLVFTVNRNGSKFLIPRILYFGEQMKNVDLQYFIDIKK